MIFFHFSLRIAGTLLAYLLVPMVGHVFDRQGTCRDNDNIIIALHSVFKQVMFAIGRDPCTQGIGLENAGVKLNPK